MPDYVKAGPWQKWYFFPIVWTILWRFRRNFDDNAELKQKLNHP